MMKQTIRTPEETFYKSPIGWIRLAGHKGGISALEFVKKPGRPVRKPVSLKKAAQSVQDYFQGKQARSNLKYALEGTLFQKKVWSHLMRVPYGRTISYQALAEKLNQKKGVRAVAQAVGRNPVAVLIPCHRIIGKDNSLTGYAYGIRKKHWLLRHEKMML